MLLVLYKIHTDVVKTVHHAPFFGFVGSISLASVLEPVADLRRGQTGDFGQRSLFARRRVRVARVAVLEDRPRLLLEAVRRLLAVPDRRRQRELAPDAVLADGAERSAARLLRLRVMRFQPERLEPGVVERRESVRLENAVEFFEVAAVESDDRLRFQNALVLVEMIARRQRPQEASQPVNAAGVLQHLHAPKQITVRKSASRKRKERKVDLYSAYRQYLDH